MVFFLVNEKLFTLLLVLYLALVFLTNGLTLHLNEFVDFKSIAVITSFIFLSRALDASGIFPNLAIKLIGLARSSLKLFMLLLLFMTAASAALIMNDASLFIYIPLTASICTLFSLPLSLMATLITLSANIGSSLTPFGNPQNIIIWQHYGIPFHEFIINLLPFFAIAFSILTIYALLLLKSSKQRVLSPPPPLKISKRLLIPSLVLLPINVALAQTGMQYMALALTASVMILLNKNIVVKADYVLIAIFVLMFADFGGIAYFLQEMKVFPTFSGGTSILLFSALLSQGVSNVPATLMLINNVKNWVPLAVGVNLGGVGLVTGSLANLITLRLSRIGWREYHKFALPYFLALLLLMLVVFWLK